jgi:predicted enzyme related to lactoylglutathione lyase
MGSTAFDLVTIDCERPDPLGAFWRGVLGLVELEREDGDRWQVIGHADGRRVLGFQRGAHRIGGVHLDLACPFADFAAEHARLESLGARTVRAPRHEPYGSIVNLADPEGNLFDLCAYVLHE